MREYILSFFCLFEEKGGLDFGNIQVHNLLNRNAGRKKGNLGHLNIVSIGNRWHLRVYVVQKGEGVERVRVFLTVGYATRVRSSEGDQTHTGVLGSEVVCLTF